MDTMPNADVDAALTELDGWVREGDAIVRHLRFPTFLDAIAFLGRIAPVAEAADHHPELSNVYRGVTVRLTTHDAGGITQRDLDLAAGIDRVVGPGVEG
jgi:4a-hydroxytetrahydrobiopterin dehydratase